MGQLYGWIVGATVGLVIRLIRWSLRMAARYPYVTAWATTAALTYTSTRHLDWENATGWLVLAVLAETWKAPTVRARRRTWRDRRRVAYRRWYRRARTEVDFYVVPVIRANHPEQAARFDRAVNVARSTGAPGLWRGYRTAAR